MSDFCGCDDLESPSVFEERDVQSARKAHQCDDCLRTILPGESYRHIWGVWPTVDGPATYRTCARCMALEEFMKAHVPCFCRLLGELRQSVNDELDNNNSARILEPEITALFADIEAQPAFLRSHR